MKRGRAAASCIVIAVSDFTHLIDLASARLGGEAVATNDDFFAEKENLVKPEPAVFIPDKYTDRGKWMDGWESRRRRTPGHDWCIVKLGLPGVIHSFVVDTAFFKGNFPSHCSIDACGLEPGADATAPGVVWHPILPQRELAGDTKNAFTLQVPHDAPRRFTHVRLNIFPDGGVARLRVQGEVLPDWTRILAGGEDVDLAAAVNGGYVVDTSDRFFGEPRNMLMPYPAPNMGDGWETKRRRGPGHDWAVVRLGIPGVIRRVELNTAHYKGNYPDSASIEAAVVPDDSRGVSADSATRAIADWKAVLAGTKLQADHLHVFEGEVAPGVAATHVRLNIFPDGGVSRFRVFGSPSPAARRAMVLRQLNAMDDPEARALLADFCGAPSWVEAMNAARPFASAKGLLETASAALDRVDRDGWFEAFRHHPRIGERSAERAQSASAAQASTREQAGVADADRAALAQANREYEARFGHVFLVSASGKSAGDILRELRARMSNDPATELRVAADELKKIARLRLERLLGS
jgi:allantoicase